MTRRSSVSSGHDVVVATTLVEVDPAVAFEVFTTEIAYWWKPAVRFRFDRDRGGVLRFEPGAGGRLLEVPSDGRAFEVGRVLAWAPGDRLVFEWRTAAFGPGERTEVEVRFESAERGTRVTVEHRGWAALPDDHPARAGLRDTAFEAMRGLYWAELLVALRARAAARPGGRA